jgi:multicomponent Na+:H+ antiporter subunit G
MFEVIAEVLLYVSGGFALLGAIGLLRFPDFYTRTHAATMMSIGGVSLALIALILADMTLNSLKIALILALILFTNPTITHAIANAAYRLGIKPKYNKATLTKQSHSRPRDSEKKERKK